MLAVIANNDRQKRIISELQLVASQINSGAAKQNFEVFVRASQVQPDELAEARIRFLMVQVMEIGAAKEPKALMSWYQSMTAWLGYSQAEKEIVLRRMDELSRRSLPPAQSPTDSTYQEVSTPPIIEVPIVEPPDPFPAPDDQLDDTLTADVHKLGKKLEEILATRRKMKYLIKRSRKALRVYQLVFEPDPSTNLVGLSEQQPNLVGHGGISANSSILVLPGRVEIHVPIEQWQPVLFEKYMPPTPPLCPVQPSDSIDGVEVLCGFDLDGKILTIPNAQRLLFAGQSGSGKTNAILTNLCAWSVWYTPEQLRFDLYDVEDASFSWFEDSPMLLRPRHICFSIDQYFSHMKLLLKERENRRRLFAKHRILSFAGWNKRFPNQRLPYIMVAIEEMNHTADLVESALKQLRKEKGKDFAPDFNSASHPIIELQEVARKQGFGTLIGSQRPSADVIDSRVKANWDVRLVFRVGSLVDSQVAFGSGETAGFRLQGDGDGFWPNDGNPIRFQSLYLGEESSAESWIKKINAWRWRQSPHAYSGLALEEEETPAHSADEDRYLRLLELEAEQRNSGFSKTELCRQLFIDRYPDGAINGSKLKWCESEIQRLKEIFG